MVWHPDRRLAAAVVMVFLMLGSSASVERPAERLIGMENLAVCYGDWGQCDSKVLTAARQGCNVIVWFAINIRLNPTSGSPWIMGGISNSESPDHDCVASVAQNLSDAKLATLHLVSVGGWDQDHPDDSCPASEVWKAFKAWNRGVVARPDLGFHGYDGIDWDIEGSDTPSNPANSMSVSLLDLIGEVSKMAKKEGYVVSMAPMESYLDPSTTLFNRSLLQPYPEWENLAPNFSYHGRNVLAYLLAKHGEVSLEEEAVGGWGYTALWKGWWGGGGVIIRDSEGASDEEKKKKLLTFDIISVQFYETYSHANFAILHQGVDPGRYFAQAVNRLTQGWIVDFSTDDNSVVSSLGLQTVRIHPKQLVIGIANAWAGEGNPVKALYLDPMQLREVHSSLLILSLTPRGYMFWSLKFEGKTPVNSTTPLYLAAVLNAILHIR